jgi:hypothetical protein
MPMGISDRSSVTIDHATGHHPRPCGQNTTGLATGSPPAMDISDHPPDRMVTFLALRPSTIRRGHHAAKHRFTMGQVVL